MRDAEIFGKENFNRVIKELASQASKIRVEGWIATSAPRVDEQVQEPDEDVNENRSDIKKRNKKQDMNRKSKNCLLYTSPSPRDQRGSRMPSSA